MVLQTIISRSPGGEIGRHKGLKIPRRKLRAGSSPAPGHQLEKNQLKKFILINIYIMQNMNQKPENSSEYFELKDIYNYILLNKNIIFIVTGLFAILSIIISLNLPNKFTSSALLTINKNNFTNNRQTSSSAFSNISGLLLPSEDYAKSIYGIEIFKSRELIYEFTDEPEVLINLFASEGWDRNSGEVLIDQNI